MRSCSPWNSCSCLRAPDPCYLFEKPPRKNRGGFLSSGNAQRGRRDAGPFALKQEKACEILCAVGWITYPAPLRQIALPFSAASPALWSRKNPYMPSFPVRLLGGRGLRPAPMVHGLITADPSSWPQRSVPPGTWGGPRRSAPGRAAWGSCPPGWQCRTR